MFLLEGPYMIWVFRIEWLTKYELRTSTLFTKSLYSVLMNRNQRIKMKKIRWQMETLCSNFNMCELLSLIFKFNVVTSRVENDISFNWNYIIYTSRISTAFHKTWTRRLKRVYIYDVIQRKSCATTIFIAPIHRKLISCTCTRSRQLSASGVQHLNSSTDSILGTCGVERNI